jgi:DNA-directed RNA polymerase omega subunit
MSFVTISHCLSFVHLLLDLLSLVNLGNSMSRITSQEAARQVGGHFKLVLAASQRARQLDRTQFIGNKKGNGVTLQALKDIEDGSYTWEDYIRDKK